MSALGGWGSMAELKFIDRLGEHAQTGADRKALLTGYLAAAQRRDNWGRIDGATAIERAKTALRRLS